MSRTLIQQLAVEKIEEELGKPVSTIENGDSVTMVYNFGVITVKNGWYEMLFEGGSHTMSISQRSLTSAIIGMKQSRDKQ